MAGGLPQIGAHGEHRPQPWRPAERDDTERAVWIQVIRPNGDRHPQPNLWKITDYRFCGFRYKTESTLLKRKIFVGGIGPLGERA